MKKRNNKILLAVIALSINTAFTVNPLATATYAAAISQTENQNIDMKAEGKTNVNLVNNTFTLTNKGNTIDLSKVKIRYYFTSDESVNGQTFNCYYSAVSGTDGKHTNITDYVHGDFIKLNTPVENADSYLEISFDEKAGTFASPENLTLNTAINNNDWSKMNSDDDYSFNNAAKTVVLVDDEVVYGTAPIENKEELPKVTLGGVTAKGGEFVDVPINISNIKKRGLSKFHITVSYDPSILQAYSYSTCIPDINKDNLQVVTGTGINRNENSIDIAYDFTKSEDTKALYEEGDYTTLRLKAVNNLEDGLSYLKVTAEPILTDIDGKEYSGDSIIVENKPIKLEYNKDAVKDSIISQNYLTFDESSLKDTDITMKQYENTVTSIECTTIDLQEPIYSDYIDKSTLQLDTDYTISNDTLTLKDSFLKTLLNSNSYLTINFDKGLSQTIFINNSKLNTIPDPLRSKKNDDEADVTFAEVSASEFFSSFPLTFAVTNTSNFNMDLEKLNLAYYYSHDHSDFDNEFTMDYCSIIGSNKDISSASNIDCRPFGLIADYMYQNRAKISFKKNSGVLKPGETLVYMMHHKGNSSITPMNNTIVTYDDEPLYGDRPDFYVRESKILSDDIKLDSETISDTPVNLELNGNALKSIDQYSGDTFVRTLEEGTDYVLTKRNEVVLKESYLKSIDENSTLDFKFSKGPDDTINIKHHNLNYPKGTLTLENTAATIYGSKFVGCPFNTWRDLTIPVKVTDTADEKITSANIILKFDNSPFSEVKVEPLNSNVVSSEVNYDLGIIKINLLTDKVPSTSEGPDFNIVLTPTLHTESEKINLSLDTDYSYYKTESGDVFSPVFNYNNVELIIAE